MKILLLKNADFFPRRPEEGVIDLFLLFHFLDNLVVGLAYRDFWLMWMWYGGFLRFLLKNGFIFPVKEWLRFLF